jgi:hypothetical protein
MIIGVSGYSGSGKDLVGTIIQYLVANNQNGYNNSSSTLNEIIKSQEEHDWWLEEQSGWEIKKWAGKLKTIASILTGIPVENFEDQEFKKTLLGPEWGTVKDIPLNSVPVFADIQFNNLISVRDFLQRLGTDAIRDGLHENTWVNALMADYIPEDVQWSDGPIGGYKSGEKLPNWIITDTRFSNEAEAIKKADGIIIRVERPGVKPINPHPSETGLDKWNFDHVINNDGSPTDLAKKIKKVLEENKII